MPPDPPERVSFAQHLFHTHIPERFPPASVNPVWHTVEGVHPCSVQDKIVLVSQIESPEEVHKFDLYCMRYTRKVCVRIKQYLLLLQVFKEHIPHTSCFSDWDIWLYNYCAILQLGFKLDMESFKHHLQDINACLLSSCWSTLGTATLFHICLSRVEIKYFRHVFRSRYCVQGAVCKWLNSDVYAWVVAFYSLRWIQYTYFPHCVIIGLYSLRTTYTCIVSELCQY